MDIYIDTSNRHITMDIFMDIFMGISIDISMSVVTYRMVVGYPLKP